MSVVPYSHIFVGHGTCVAVSGSLIYALNSITGEVLSSASNATEGQAKGLNATTGLVVTAAVNEDFTRLSSVGEDKVMKLWELPELKLINERELPKRPTCLAFTRDSQTILVSDKFGDVFSYPFHYVPPKSKPVRDELSSHENPSDGQLVLGHTSPLNALLLSHDERYIITADRDEHIRVSWYPQGYNIEAYCLGHRRYVSAIHIPPFSPETLISGGGDPNLKLWNWMSGRCTEEVKIWELVEPFVVVKSKKQKHAEEGEDDDEMQKRKGKGKKAKRRAKKEVQEKIEQKDDDERAGEGEAEAEGREGEQGANDASETAEEKVLVVSKIGSVRMGDAYFVVFSAVGATALFGFRYPTGVVEHMDFGHPIIDLTTDGTENIWVSLDMNRSAPGPGSSKDTRLVRVVRVGESGESGKFVETSSCPENPLLKSLNENCAIAGPSNKCLDFYADLKGMPKWSEPSARMTMDSVQDVGESVSSTAAPKPLTRREEARMKNKKNVLVKMREMEEGDFAPFVPSGDENEMVGKVRAHEEIEGGDDEGREAKRAKSVMDSGDNDVEMHS